jgi:hypothetical protein
MAYHEKQSRESRMNDRGLQIIHPPSSLSVSSGKDHRHAMFVGRGDELFLFDRAARRMTALVLGQGWRHVCLFGSRAMAARNRGARNAVFSQRLAYGDGAGISFDRAAG